MPVACNVVFLADRGFADTELMHHLKRLGWHFRIGIKSNFWIYRSGHGGFQVRAIALVPGQTRFWHGVLLTTKRFGPVHLAVGGQQGVTGHVRPHGAVAQDKVRQDSEHRFARGALDTPDGETA